MRALKQSMNAIYYWEFQCQGFFVHVASSHRGTVMVKLDFTRENSFMTELISSAPNAELIEDRTHNAGLIGIIEAYLKGNNPAINVPWDINVTPFMYNVYRSACTIPYGETKTYKDVASMAGTPKGARAVGQALKKNPLVICIPCHRVVAVNGLGGFNSGIDIKRYLLDLEQGEKKERREN
jgi:O-6-methylguanine DNA methyltransferase